MRSALTFPRLLAWLLVLLLPACVDPYSPEVLAVKRSYLVVDGFLNAQGVTTIRLSRTFAIASQPKVPAETRATVYIEDVTGMQIPLTESLAGTYTSGPHSLNPARTYRLRILTTAGVQYASDFVPVKTTPALDAVDWRIDNSEVGVYASTHDDTGATQYYRWEYEETWEIIPPLNPSLEFYNNMLIPIRVPYPIRCWGTERGPAVQLAKTTALSKDVVRDQLLRRLPRSTERLYRRYSILVQQHALTKDEYGYWDQLRKNTESIGTLFDPQPSQLTGNVHCLSNNDELVFGFVGAHSLTERRIFIDRRQLPPEWPYISGYEACMPPDTSKDSHVYALFRSGRAVPVNQSYTGLVVSTPDCVDCRLRGSATKPTFW